MIRLDNTKFEGHLYLDHHHPPTLWNIVRGGFDSVDNLPLDDQDFALSVAMASMIGNGAAMRLESELRIEIVRQLVSPRSVSRLTGLFVFDDIWSLAQIWDANRWGEHFRQDYLTDVGVDAKRSSRHDANWIACMIGSDGSLMLGWEQAAESYWKGLPKLGTTPIWERIVCGTFYIWSMHSKRSALQEVEAIWPQSLNLLATCMNLFAVGSHDGQIFPGVTTTDDALILDYYLRMKDVGNPDVSHRIQRLSENDPKMYTPPLDDADWVLPDLTGFQSSLPLSNTEQFARVTSLLQAIRLGRHPTNHLP
ncbi:hypothetical protein [Achromobacter insolitus]|uniref:hypothetical protein n=1 Tax=Achromobacter insolitus TaxID=217204 RepID=UPI0007C68EAA|nr:hypothetical protein [Achromobacter insolitus]OCZ57854.1 hypothetical protein A7P22_11905 [Achromobacter insolitus]